MRFYVGEGCEGYGEGLRFREVLGCKKINVMNSIFIFLVYRDFCIFLVVY